jgi:ankyrin repeat protein
MAVLRDTAVSGSKDVSNRIVELLIEKGADVNVRDDDGYTPLSYAAMIGDFSKVQILLAHNANPKIDGKNDATPMHLSVALGPSAQSPQIIRALISHGADIEARDKIGRTPLYIAVEHHHASAEIRDIETVDALLSLKADINAKANRGWTPLHVAVWHGDVGMARYLIAHGADVHAKDKKGRTPRDVAEINRAELCKLLASSGG